MQHLAPETRLNGGNYIIEETIGQGRFGITYRAYSLHHQKKVILKEFFPSNLVNRDPATMRMVPDSPEVANEIFRMADSFTKELSSIAQINHPNVVTILDQFKENGTHYYVTELVDGQTLEKISTDSVLPTSQTIRYIASVADALSHIHSRGINHLNINPASIIIRSADNEPILVEFGHSINFLNTGSQTSVVNPDISNGYTPLELFYASDNTFSPESDLYSLTATLFTAITQKTPPEPSAIIDEGGLVLPPYISPGLQTFIRKGMSIAKADRFHSAADYRTSLLQAFNGNNRPAMKSPMTPPMPRPQPSAYRPATPQQPVAVQRQPKVAPPMPKPQLHETQAAPQQPVIAPQQPVAMPPMPKPQVRPTDIVIPENEKQIEAIEESEKIYETPTPATGGGAAIPPVNDSSQDEALEEPTEPAGIETNIIAEENAISPADDSGKSKNSIMIAAGIIAVVIAGAVAAFLFSQSGDDAANESSDPASPSAPIKVERMAATFGGLPALYTGRATADSIPDGPDGYIEFTDGPLKSYKGNIVEGEVTGKGKVVYRSGDTFEGTLSNTSFVEGTLRYASGKYYTGTFANDAVDTGTWYSKDGKPFAKVTNGKEQQL